MIKYEHHRSFKKDRIAFGSTANLRFPAHMHHSFEYVTVTAGKIKMEVCGKEFTLSKNDSVLVLPGQIHSYEPVEGPVCEVCLGIFSLDCLPELCAPPYCDSPKSPFIPSSANAPSATAIGAVSGDRFLAKAKLYELASVYLKGPSFVGAAASKDRFAAGFLDYLGAHFTEPISLLSTAHTLGYNYRYLSGMVSDCFGTSFVKLLGEYRISHACRLLCESDIGITEISSRCGFESIRSFNRTFKRLCGVTPSEYRKNAVSGK